MNRSEILYKKNIQWKFKKKKKSVILAATAILPPTAILICLVRPVLLLSKQMTAILEKN
jgi:hypothetical protein